MDGIAETGASIEIKSSVSEQLDAISIPNIDKANITLLTKKLKPATFFDLEYFPFRDATYPLAKWRADTERLTSLFDSLSFPIYVADTKSWKSPVSEDSIGKTFHVGIDQEHLDQLLAALRNPSFSESNRATGLALGYPATAVEAWSSKPRTTIYKKDLPPEVRDSDVIKFVGFALSRDHWQEELEQVKRIAAAIHETDPKLYHSIIAAPPNY